MSSKNSPAGVIIVRQAVHRPGRRTPPATASGRSRRSNLKSFQHLYPWREGIEMKLPREERTVRERHDRSHKLDFPVGFFAFLAPRAFPALPAFRACLAVLASL